MPHVGRQVTRITGTAKRFVVSATVDRLTLCSHLMLEIGIKHSTQVVLDLNTTSHLYCSVKQV